MTIDAAPSDVWPWLVQMGPKPRAGAYTYDVIDRLLGIDIQNADRVLLDYQHLEPGEFLGINNKGAGLLVREVQAERCLVLQWQPTQSTWTFALYPQDDGRARLVSRNRLTGSGPWFWLSIVALMEPGSLVMERKMLLGLKRRAEKLAHAKRSSASV